MIRTATQAVTPATPAGVPGAGDVGQAVSPVIIEVPPAVPAGGATQPTGASSQGPPSLLSQRATGSLALTKVAWPTRSPASSVIRGTYVIARHLRQEATVRSFSWSSAPFGPAGVGGSGGPAMPSGLNGGGASGGSGAPGGVQVGPATPAMIMLWLTRHSSDRPIWRSYGPEVSPA
ncbi:MAG TPA: hypothetical protein VMA73_16300 [Streptosporangiaceae bacterium]|nr:hypothetical protein [Streptosporangiaceae bacterium]